MGILAALAKFVVGPIAGPIFLVGFLVTAGAFAITSSVQAWKLSQLTGERDDLRTQIFGPTGFAARLSQCQTNAGNLDAALGLVRDQIAELEVAAAARDAANRAAIAVALAGVGKRITESTTRLLTSPPTQTAGTLDACRAGARILKTGEP